MTTIILRRDYLLAALCTAAKQDIRYYLNGVLIEASATMTRYVSMNGHMMSIQQHESANGMEIALIIPREVIERVKPHKTLDELTLDRASDGVYTLVDPAGATQTFKPIDGKFPEYQRVVPKLPLAEGCGQFDPQYIAAFSKAAKARGNKAGFLTLAHNGRDGAALVSIGVDDYLGVLMPLRGYEFTDKTFAHRDALVAPLSC